MHDGAPTVEINVNGGTTGEVIPDLSGPDRPHYEPLPTSSYNSDVDAEVRYDGEGH